HVPAKVAILSPFGGISPPFCHPVGFESGRGQPLSGTQGKTAATFALVTTVGPEPRPGRSTPGELGRAADREAFASLSYPTNRQVLRNPHVERPGFLVSMSIHPRTAVRPGRCACLLLTPNCQRLFARSRHTEFTTRSPESCECLRKSEMDTSLESSLRGGVIAPRSRPGSPGGARPDARRLPATGHGWQRRNGPATGPRPASATALASSRRYSPDARRSRPAHWRSRLCLAEQPPGVLHQEQVIAQRESFEHPTSPGPPPDPAAPAGANDCPGSQNPRRPPRRFPHVPRTDARSSFYAKPSSAPDLSGASQTFRVTHPFHPLCGREFTLVTYRRDWGGHRVYFH